MNPNAEVGRDGTEVLLMDKSVFDRFASKRFDMYEPLIRHRVAAIRERLLGGRRIEELEDGRHVFVVTMPLRDGTPHVGVWRHFEAAVRCIARMEAFGVEGWTFHWVVVNEED